MFCLLVPWLLFETVGCDTFFDLFPLFFRLVHEFTHHSGAITAIAIHPTEFLMATAAADRTLRLWDLESFDQVCCMPPESGQVSLIRCECACPGGVLRRWSAKNLLGALGSTTFFRG